MVTDTGTLRGAELLRAAVNQLIEHPDTWDQSDWHRDTKHCVGGWCQIIAGRPKNGDECEREVAALLGISLKDAEWLFSPHRTLSEIHGFATDMLAGRATFDSYGRDRDGYDRDGYDMNDVDREGRFRGHCYGYDGYDRAGYDRAGYDRRGRHIGVARLLKL